MIGLKFFNDYKQTCLAKDVNTGKTLFQFKAREYSECENGANFVSGGVASGNQKYQIKTNDKRAKKLRPFANLVVVEDVEYMLTFIKIRKADLPFAYVWQRGANDEFILELQ